MKKKKKKQRKKKSRQQATEFCEEASTRNTDAATFNLKK
jgi:hypothetical protein